jgi:cytochrome c oxidase accessory protein FixG
MGSVHLPIVDDANDVRGSILADGKRKRIVVADVKGRFHTARNIVIAALLVFAAALPWIPIHGAPAVFLDIEHRKFFLFGATFNAQDAWLVFFLLSGTGFALVYATAIAGRAWCGWACPQTVFLDGVYRRIERWIEGPRNKHLQRDASASFARTWRKIVKHLAFAIVSVVVAHVFLSYFVSLRAMFHMVRQNPAAHPEAFAWATGMSALFYVNFALFREQFCVVLCPYGRLQSVLLDDDSLVVGYDEKRGEPRGKKKKGDTSSEVGDCVDCHRCVVVCPTGIDIRDGLQLDCVACTACIDACDEVMERLDRPRGLIRYDSPHGLAGEPTRFFRPRILLYTGLLVVGAVVAGLALRSRTDFEATVTRLPGAPYTLDGDSVRNGFDVHLINKTGDHQAFDLQVEAPPGGAVVLPMSHIELESMAQAHTSIFVVAPRSLHLHDALVHVTVLRAGSGGHDAVVSNVRFLGE